jgi:hypothetical protein
MSRSIDLFIDSARPIDELAAEIQRLARLTMQPLPAGEGWKLEEGGVQAELRTHPFANDGDLLLERYQYVLGCRVSSSTRLLDAPETALLRLVSEALQRGGFQTLLVHDLQYRDAAALAASSRSGSAPGPAPGSQPTGTGADSDGAALLQDQVLETPA